MIRKIEQFHATLSTNKHNLLHATTVPLTFCIHIKLEIQLTIFIVTPWIKFFYVKGFSFSLSLAVNTI